MPGLLIVSRNPQSLVFLQKLAELKDVRSKSSSESKMALDWLRLRSFSAAFVDADISLLEQQDLATLLWRNNPLAPFVVFDLEATSNFNQQEARLFGADIARGAEAVSILNKALDFAKREASTANGNFQIMVVEDLDAPRDIICAYVESLGFSQVEGKASAKEAMQALERNPRQYSCVITDIRMPEISGQKLIEFVRQHQNLSHLPIIALTAYGSVDCLVDCLKAGASGFLVKPPKKDDLSRELGRALRLVHEGKSPRLATSSEADSIRSMLIDRGFS